MACLRVEGKGKGRTTRRSALTLPSDPALSNHLVKWDLEPKARFSFVATTMTTSRHICKRLARNVSFERAFKLKV
jgi:hypothetical protein